MTDADIQDTVTTNSQFPKRCIILCVCITHGEPSRESIQTPMANTGDAVTVNNFWGEYTEIKV